MNPNVISNFENLINLEIPKVTSLSNDKLPHMENAVLNISSVTTFGSNTMGTSTFTDITPCKTVTSVPASAFGSADVSCNDVVSGDWVYNTASHYIIKYNGTDTDITIPTELDGYNIVGVYGGSLPSTITTLHIPSTCKYIDFSDVPNLKILHLNSTLNDYNGNKADESILNNLILDKLVINVKALMDWKTFANLNVKQVDIIGTDNLTDLTYYSGTNFFENNTHLTKLNLTEYTGTNIPKSFAKNATSLKIIQGLESIKNIGTNAFESCTGLTEVDLSNVNGTISNSAFSGCSNLTNLNLDNSNLIIDTLAFSNTKLTDVTFSREDSIKNINAFPDNMIYRVYFLSNLGEFLYEKDYPRENTIFLNDELNYTQGNYTLKVVTKDNVYKFMLTGTGVESGSEAWNLARKYMTQDILNIFKDVTELPADMFNGNPNITQYRLPSGVQKVGARAYANCPNIKSIDIPSTVTHLGDNALNTNSSTLYKVTIRNEECYYGNNVLSSTYKGLLYGYPDSTTEAYVATCDWTFKAIDGTLVDGTVRDTNGNIPTGDFIVDMVNPLGASLNNFEMVNNGEYVYEAVPNGQYKFVLYQDGVELARTNLIHINNGTVTGDTNFIIESSEQPNITYTITGTVRDASNKLLKNIPVSFGDYSAVTDVNGNYKIENIPENTRAVLLAQLDNKVTKGVEHNIAGNETIDLVFDVSFTKFELQFKDKDNQPVQNAQVTLDGKEPSYTTDNNGAITTDYYVSGNYDLTIIINDKTYHANTADNPIILGNKYQIDGSVVDKDGNPASNLTIQFGNDTRTDITNGQYNIPELYEGTYSVKVINSYNQVLFEGDYILDSDSTYDIQLNYNLTDISGTLTDISGNPINGAQVTVDELGTLVTGTDGSYSFNNVINQEYTITISYNGDIFTTTSENPSIQLIAGYTIGGVVKDESNNPINGATVKCGSVTTTTDSNGRFEFLDIPNGTYNIEATKDNLNGNTLITVLKGNQECEIIIKEPVTTTTYKVYGYVTNSKGNPVQYTMATVGTQPTATDANGYYEVTISEPGVLTVTCTSNGVYATKNIQVTADTQCDLQLPAGEKYTVTGKVVDYENNPVSNAIVSIINYGTALTDENGSFELEDIENGLQTIYASYNGVAVTNIISVTNNVDTTITLPKPLTINITGTIKDASNQGIKDVEVFLLKNGSTSARRASARAYTMRAVTVLPDDITEEDIYKRTFTNQEGYYAFVDVPVGSYRAIAQLDDEHTYDTAIEVSQEGNNQPTIEGDTNIVTDTVGSVTGSVVDINGTPIEGAVVEIAGNTTTTDSDGKYTFDQIVYDPNTVIKATINNITQQITINPNDISGSVPTVTIPTEISDPDNNNPGGDNNDDNPGNNNPDGDTNNPGNNENQDGDNSNGDNSNPGSNEGNNKPGNDEDKNNPDNNNGNNNPGEDNPNNNNPVDKPADDNLGSNTGSNPEDNPGDSNNQNPDINNNPSNPSDDSNPGNNPDKDNNTSGNDGDGDDINNPDLNKQPGNTNSPDNDGNENDINNPEDNNNSNEGGNEDFNKPNDTNNPDGNKGEDNNINKPNSNNPTNISSSSNRKGGGKSSNKATKPKLDDSKPTKNKDGDNTSIDGSNNNISNSINIDDTSQKSEHKLDILSNYNSNDVLTRADVAKILYAYNITTPTTQYSDVQPDKWYNDYITNTPFIGYGDDTVKAEQLITRAEFTTLLVRIKFGDDKKDTQVQNVFYDTDANAWYAGTIQFAYDHKLINGYPDGTFKPNQGITYNECITMIDNALRLN